VHTPIEEIDKALDVLALPKLITKADIKKQYRFFARKYHPDRGGNTQDMEQINYAYAFLMNYIEEFRYTFDEHEVNKQFPGIDYAKQFNP